MDKKPALLVHLLLAIGLLTAACSSTEDTASDGSTTSAVRTANSSSTTGAETPTTAVTIVVDPDSIESFDEAFEALMAAADSPEAAADFEAYFDGLSEDEQTALLDETFGFTSAEESDAFFARLVGVDPSELAQFAVEGSEATMTGIINGSTPDAVRRLISDHPALTTIVMVDVPGSIDDEANLEAALLVREAGLNTHLDADGSVASGGVDFYLAGVERTFEPGASFGVHSWADIDGTEGKDIPEDDAEHRRYLDYYEQVGIASEFYWFTLDAAPADDIYVMTPADLETYGFATDQ
ncbi:MAG: hypothetical protein ACR2QO_22000 [Acidimicrobiales bacterium]